MSNPTLAQVIAAITPLFQDAPKPPVQPLPPTRTLRESYPSAQALQADSDLIRFTEPIIVHMKANDEGVLIHHGVDEGVNRSPVEYTRQWDGSFRRADLPPLIPPGSPPTFTTPPSTSTTTLPAEFQGRAVVNTTLPWGPWTPQSRRYSEGFDDSNVWAVHFATRPFLPSDWSRARIAAIESASQPVLRTWILVRDRDGAQILRSDPDPKKLSSTVGFQFGPAPGNDWTAGLEPDTDYTLFIANLNGGGGGQMMVELYL